MEVEAPTKNVDARSLDGYPDVEQRTNMLIAIANEVRKRCNPDHFEIVFKAIVDKL